jgi:glycosyltransferase 2 family protein
MSGRAWAAARLLGGVLILVAVVWRVGPGPLLDGVRGLGPGALLAALALGAATTLCQAWRWRVVAAALGDGLALPAATAACYRSQFLNSALPGGVIGDVHRGVRSGIDAGDVGRGLRAVAWERVAGQLVQAAVALAVLAVVPSPLQAALPWIAVLGVVAVGVLLMTGRGVARHGPARVGRALRNAALEARGSLLRPTVLGPVLLASLLASAGYVGMFVVAARAAGVQASTQRLLPLALVVLLAAAIPVNVAGWGPREGAAVWVFAAADVGAAAGASVATAFGVLTLVAVLPGALVLLAGRRHPPPAVRPAAPLREPVAVVVHGGTREDGPAHG